MQEDETEPAEVQEVVDVVTTTKIITEVITGASETITTASITITAAEAQVPATTLNNAKEDLAVKQYDVILKELMKNQRSVHGSAKVKGWKLLESCGVQIITFTTTHLILFVYRNCPLTSETITTASITITAAEAQVPATTLNVDPLRVTAAPRRRIKGRNLNLKKQQQIKQDKKYARELEAELIKIIDWDEVIDHVKKNAKEDLAVKQYDVILKELMDLEALWSLVKEIFSITKPKNFSDDSLLVTLRAMFEKPDIYAQIWKNKRNVHGPAKVKGWKLLESYGVQIITFTTTPLILLVERKYPLTRFNLDQMLNAVRLEIEEESEVSLELLSFIHQQHQEGQLE
nr:hypothetical protein [Tanacetum cinerariifolium]